MMHRSGLMQAKCKCVMVGWISLFVFSFSVGVQGSEFVQNSQHDTSKLAQNKIQTKSVGKNPFFIVVVGDSIAWGSGLVESEKFSSRVAKWLAQSLHGRRQVVRVSCARAGAMFGKNIAASEPQLCDNKVHINKSDKVAAIQQQVDMAVNTLRQQHDLGPESVELVLMTGGMNDVGLPDILDPEVGTEVLRVRTREIYQTALTGDDGLLAKTARVFPKAKIIYAGNYNILSNASSSEVLLDIFPFSRAKSAEDLHQLKPQLVEQSTAFFEESNKQIKLAISKLEKSDQARLKFVIPDFKETDSIQRGKVNYSTAQPPALYTLNELYEFDEMLQARVEICKGDVFCDYGSVGHPTRVGATKYARAIQKAILPFMPTWIISGEMSSRNKTGQKKEKSVTNMYGGL